MSTKQKLLQICNERVDKRINDYKAEIDLIKESIESNDKENSEGDDSGNGKLLNDLEKNMEHLNDAHKTKIFLKDIKTNINSDKVMLGSLVKTDSIHFYLAASMGKIELDDCVYYAISLSSPIGQLLKNKSKNDYFEFNQTSYIIQDII